MELVSDHHHAQAALRSRNRSVLHSLDRRFRAVDINQQLTGEAYLRSKRKRALDILVSLPLCFATLPVVTTLLVLVFLEDGHAPIFRHTRVGKNGKLIRLWKIRSMKPNSDNGLASHQLACNHRASENPNNTQLGRILRRYQLDELPQLWQVLFGQLSLVGARPLTLAELVAHQDKPDHEAWFHAYSQSVGLTGVSQVHRRKTKQDRGRFTADCFQAERASLLFDLYILWSTLLRLVAGSY